MSPSASASTFWLLLLAALLPPQPREWEIVRSEDGDFAFAMPEKPGSETRNVPGRTGSLEVLTYSCLADGSDYSVRRIRAPRPVPPEQVIAELAHRRKADHLRGARPVTETPIVTDGVVGHDFTSTVPSPHGEGDVTRRIRHYLTGHSYYVLTVTSPPGRPLPADATRFLSSLTFEALVKAHYIRIKEKPRPESESAAPGGSPRAGDRAKATPPSPKIRIELADATPEEALKTFLLALAAQDQASLRGVALPDEEFPWLLKATPAPPEVIAQLKARLEAKPIRRLRAGDRVRMPDGETRVVKPDDVREGRIVLWPEGAPLPTRLEIVGGRWRVFARPFIVARKAAETIRSPVPPTSPDRPLRPK